MTLQLLKTLGGIKPSEALAIVLSMHGAVDKSIPSLRLPEFRRPPAYADLANIVRVCEKNKDRYIIQPWSLPNNNQLYSLRAFLPGSGDEYLRLKSEGKLVHPEWTLFVGPENAEELVWIYSTRDLDLILGLIMSEVEGQARAANVPLQSVTLKEMPSLRNRALQQAQDYANPTGTGAQPANTSPTGEAFNTPPQAAPQSLSNGQNNNAFDNTASSVSQAPVTAKLSPSLRSALPPQPAQPGQPGGGVVLSGNISGAIELQNVIHSIALCKMYGALVFNRDLEQACIFFENGEVVDSLLQKGFAGADSAADLRGDHAFLEILTWNSGSFFFDYSRKAFSATITRKTQTLLTEGLMLRDYCEALSARGIDIDTTFVPATPQLSPANVEAKLKEGLPLGLQWQLGIYGDLHGGLSLYELLKRKPMPKAIWAPVIYNLLSLQLITCAGQNATPQTVPTLDMLQLDGDAMSAFAREISRPDTGICNQSAFCFFVSRELQRFKQTGRAFSVLIIQPRVRRGKGADGLSIEALRECTQRLCAGSGALDVVGHYQLLELGILMPESGELSNWLDVVNRVRRCITWPLLPGIPDDEDLLLTISVYGPDSNGNLVVQGRKTFPE